MPVRERSEAPSRASWIGGLWMHFPRNGRAATTASARRLPAGACGRARAIARYVMIGMINSATMFATLIIGLIAGPAVSL